MKQKLKSLCANLFAYLLTLAVALVGANALADGWLGDYENTSNWTISSVADMTAFAEAVNGGYDFAGKTVKLMAALSFDGATYVPVGTKDHPFRGTFDGNNKYLSKITFTAEQSYCGVFGYVEGGTLRNVKVEYMASAASHCGGLAAVMNGGVIESTSYYNVRVDGSSTFTGATCVGGLVGEADGVTLKVGTGAILVCGNGLKELLAVAAAADNSNGVLIGRVGSNGIDISGAQLGAFSLQPDGAPLFGTIGGGRLEFNKVAESQGIKVSALCGAKADGVEIVIQTGKFGFDMTEYLPAGKVAVPEGDGLYHVGTPFELEFVEALSTGTLTLSSDVTSAATYEIPEDCELTVNLNGYTWTSSSTVFENYGSLTLKDGSEQGNGKIVVTGRTNAIDNFGVLAVLSGTYDTSAVESPYNCFVYTYDDYYGVGTTYVSGGTFLTGADDTFMQDEYGSDAVTEVSGGTFNKPVGESFIAAGYKCETAPGGGYRVVEDIRPPVAMIGDQGFATIFLAVANAKNGDVVKLVDDIELGADGVILIDGKSIVIDLNGCTISSAMTSTSATPITIKYKSGLVIRDTSSAGTGKVVVTGKVDKYDWSTGVIRMSGTVANFTLEGGTLEAANGSVITDSNGEVLISGGVVKGPGTAKEGLISAKKLTVTGGQILKTGESDYPLFGGNTKNPVLKGGIYSMDPSAYLGEFYAAVKLDTTPETWRVDFTAVASIGDKLYSTFEDAIADWKAGDEIVVLNPEAEIPDDWKVVDGKLVRKPDIARIGEKTYTSLEKAFGAVNGGETVELLANVTEPNFLFPLGKAGTVTFDLQGYTLKITTWLDFNGVKVLVKNGTIDCTDATGKGYPDTNVAVICAHTSSVDFEGVKIISKNTGGYAFITTSGVGYTFNGCEINLDGGCGFNMQGASTFIGCTIAATNVWGVFMSSCKDELKLENTTVTVDGTCRQNVAQNWTLKLDNSSIRVLASGDTVFTGIPFNSSNMELTNGSSVLIEGCNSIGFTGARLTVNDGCSMVVSNAWLMGVSCAAGDSVIKAGGTLIAEGCGWNPNANQEHYRDIDVCCYGTGNNFTVEKGATVRVSNKISSGWSAPSATKCATFHLFDGWYNKVVAEGSDAASACPFDLTGGLYKEQPDDAFVNPYYEAVENTNAVTKAEGYAWMIAKKELQVVTEPKTVDDVVDNAKLVDESGAPVETPSEQQKAKVTEVAEKVVEAQSAVSVLTFTKTEIDKSVMNPPTSPDGKPTVKANIVAGLKETALAAGLSPEAVNAQIKSDSEVNRYIDVDIKTPEMKLVGSDVNLKALTYDVKPMVKTIVIIKDGDNDVTNVVKRQVQNSEIVRPLKFRMPLTEEFAGKNIKVTHSKDPEGLEPVEGSWRTRVYPVMGSGNDDVYVEAESDVFSYFKNELTVDQPTQVEVQTGGVWTAVSSLGDAASIASEATERGETGVIIRLVANQTEGCILPLNVTLQTNGHTIGTVTPQVSTKGTPFTLTLDENGVYRCIDFGVSDVKVKQRYPWNGLVDISYTLSDSLPSGYDLIVTLEDPNNAQIKYSATTFLAPPTFNKGVNTVVWNAFADLNGGLVLRNFKCKIWIKKRLN